MSKKKFHKGDVVRVVSTKAGRQEHLDIGTEYTISGHGDWKLNSKGGFYKTKPETTGIWESNLELVRSRDQKFSVGDWVKVVGVTDGYRKYNGAIGQVTKIRDSSVWPVEVDTEKGYGLAFDFKELEAAEEPRPKTVDLPVLTVVDSIQGDRFVKISKDAWVTTDGRDGRSQGRLDQVPVYRDKDLDEDKIAVVQ